MPLVRYQRARQADSYLSNTVNKIYIQYEYKYEYKIEYEYLYPRTIQSIII